MSDIVTDWVISTNLASSEPHNINHTSLWFYTESGVYLTWIYYSSSLYLSITRILYWNRSTK